MQNLQDTDIQTIVDSLYREGFVDDMPQPENSNTDKDTLEGCSDDTGQRQHSPNNNAPQEAAASKQQQHLYSQNYAFNYERAEEAPFASTSTKYLTSEHHSNEDPQNKNILDPSQTPIKLNAYKQQPSLAARSPPSVVVNDGCQKLSSTSITSLTSESCTEAVMLDEDLFDR